jgi:hypothetical protein
VPENSTRCKQTNRYRTHCRGHDSFLYVHDVHGKFLTLSVGLIDNQTTMVSAGSLNFALCLQPVYGALSDRIGRKPLLIWFGLMGTVFTIPASSPAIRKERRRRVRVDRGGVADRRRLYGGKCGSESGAVPNQSSSCPDANVVLRKNSRRGRLKRYS